MESPVIQLLVLAGIAVFLILRLKSVLGTREGFEKPIAPPAERPSKRPEFEVIEGGPDQDITDYVPEGSAQAEDLAAMKKVEPSFQVRDFVQGARGAYEMILMAFERGETYFRSSFMAENGAPEGVQQPQVQMSVLGQFIRDMSFENVMAQKGGGADVQPDVSVQVALDAKKRSVENQYEVITKLNIESKSKDGSVVLFVLELEYVGIFNIAGVPEDQLHPFLLIECPRMLFPFLRRIVSDVTRDGGFPPLNLDNIDFVAIYRNELARRQQASAAEQPQQ